MKKFWQAYLQDIEIRIAFTPFEWALEVYKGVWDAGVSFGPLHIEVSW